MAIGSPEVRSTDSPSEAASCLAIWYRSYPVGHKVKLSRITPAQRRHRACSCRRRRDHRRATGFTADTAIDAIAKLMIGLLPARLTQPAAPLKLQVGAHAVAGESERPSK